MNTSNKSKHDSMGKIKKRNDSTRETTDVKRYDHPAPANTFLLPMWLMPPSLSPQRSYGY